MKGKNFAGWVPGEFVKPAEDLVAERGVTQSEFVAGLVIDAVKGAPPKLKDNPSVLLELARNYHPTITEELERSLAARACNQKRAVARLLEALGRALEDPEFDPASDFDLVDRRQRRAWEKTSDERILLAARQLAADLNAKGAAALLKSRDEITPENEPLKKGRREPR